ncbi:dephospho-CoA kinase [Saccharopolyspora gloriosae]|uniref:dephospho-CoA kinase n=1 Tax=Saccharopolyspora gloriosae TaxID=455344 RepID=UPI001FB70115|nr:dephospho-CoA kinase [Saccharopolyspora gloriosae]
MLRVGLSGGIGSGKSTVAARLVELGAVLIDADVLAREVVQPGSAGLAELAERFGPEILTADGALDRPAMARKVFGDDQARADLNAITHPKIGALTVERMAQAPADAIVVHDVPLLVENDYAANYHLVLIVDAPEDERVRRLTGRGLDAEDARARIRSQATDEQRREAADVWLDNTGAVEDLVAEVDRLWSERLVPFEANVRAGRRATPLSPRIVEPDSEWPRAARRLSARVLRAAGEKGVRVDHVGSTSVPGLPAKDVIDLQLAVRSIEDAEAVAESLGEAGFPAYHGIQRDNVHDIIDPDPAGWLKRFHTSADPGRYVNLHVRVFGSPGWRVALLFRDWLRADADARAGYVAVKRELAERFGSDPDHERYAEAKEPWFLEALPRAQEWAERTGWAPPEN